MRLIIIFVITIVATLITLPAGSRGRSSVDLNNMGVEALESGQYQQAIEYLLEAYQLDQKNNKTSMIKKI